MTGSWRCVGTGLLAVLLLVIFAPNARSESGASSALASASAPTPVPEIPLPELPALAPIALSTPKADAVRSLDGRLDQLLATEVADPLEPVDFGFLTDGLDDDIVPAIASRLDELRERLDGGKASALLDKARSTGRRAIRKTKKDKGRKEAGSDGDWLVFILALGGRDDPTWQGSAELYGILRMLEHLGTTPAARQMVACYGYFGELVRIDVQRAFERMKDKAVPALIEAKSSDVQKTRRWAVRQLDSLGRAIPGEAASTTDQRVLADVLRAFGRIKDVDATRVILSFANSERAQLRQAAREAIAAIGEPATWHLKDTYKSLTGDKPPRSWDWKRTARELFRLHDRARLAAVYDLMEEGRKALAQGRHHDATTAFDQVLARSPLFEARAEMAPAYLGLADELAAKGATAEAKAALRKALRIAPDHPTRSNTESRLAFLEGLALAEKGTPDRFILERALELDPGNAEAKKLLLSLEERAEKRQTRWQRHAGAIGVAVVALVALVLLWRRRKPRKAQPSPAPGRPG